MANRVVVEDVSVKLSVYQKLPKGSTIVGVFDDVADMDGKMNRAFKVYYGNRICFFSVADGRYLGDDIC